MNYLSACLVTKDENSYLPEWISFHRLIGVEHFYVYDNESSIPVEQTLAPEISKGFVTMRKFPGRGIQLPVYHECLKEFGTDSRWMAFIDDDEFLFSPNSDDIRAILEPFEKFGGLCANWLVFGSSGHTQRPAGLQIENFVRRATKPYDLNRYIKWILQPSKTSKMESAHKVKFLSGSWGVNENERAIEGPMGMPHATDRIRVNHYYFRSRQEWETKVARGRVNKGGVLPVEAFDIHDKKCSEEKDTTILRFSERLKEVLALRGEPS